MITRIYIFSPKMAKVFDKCHVSLETKVNGDNKFPDFVILMKSELQLVKENIHVLFIHFDRLKWKT